MNIKTRLRSTAIQYFSSERYQQRLRRRGRKRRIKQGQEPVVHYFHQVDDPYSHLAVQKLDVLKAKYKLPFLPHLVSKPNSAYQGSEKHFEQWAIKDAVSIAQGYGVQLHTRLDLGLELPLQEARVAQANQILAAQLTEPEFSTLATTVGNCLWSGTELPTNSTANAAAALAAGNQLRQDLGHYLGGMFYFDGEWYWGVDRIRLLEIRLVEEGFRPTGTSLCVPEPEPHHLPKPTAGSVLLEYFPSLRSPYTAFGHPRVLDLIKRTGVQVRVRPVMPMLMRGVPAPQAKQRYIITDAAREARYRGVPLDRVVDPFGEPVKRAFALFPAADAMGKGLEFVTAYLAAAWFDGVDITTKAGLEKVAQNAGINWPALQDAADEHDWEAVLDSNLSEMLRENLWGVPSFRVSGGSLAPYACWGQDRIWRVESEITKRAEVENSAC